MTYSKQNIASDLQQGVGCLQQNNLAIAAACFNRILAHAPKHPDALHLLGLVYARRNEHVDALKLIKRAVKLQPKDSRFHRSLGLVQAERGKDKEALASLRKAVLLSPKDSGLHNDLGLFLSQRGRTVEAIAEYRKAVQCDSKNIMALSNLANDLLQTEQVDESCKCYETAVALDEGYFDAQYGLAQALALKPDAELAVAQYRKVLLMQPEHKQANNKLGSLLKNLGDLDGAVELISKAVSIDPEYAGAHNNLGNALRKQGHIEESFACYQRALEIDPQYADAHWNRSLGELLLGRFDSGWVGYEWRWQCDAFVARRRAFKQPQWDGSRLGGKTILLHAEQGNGDSIQFIRYVSVVAALGGKVVVECQRSLKSLFATVAGIDVLVAAGDPLPRFDVHSAFLSLPGILGTDLSSIPADIPYLTAEAAAALPSVDAEVLKVGIVWAGSPTHVNDHNRSVALNRFVPLGDSNVQLYSLQVGAAAADLDCLAGGKQILNAVAGVEDYAETAAIIQQLDLVVSVDTSVAHLAGALGKPVWILLPFMPDWRWMLERDDSPWYPSMRLFRQQQGGWDQVFADLSKALSELSVNRI